MLISCIFYTSIIKAYWTYRMPVRPLSQPGCVCSGGSWRIETHTSVWSSGVALAMFPITWELKWQRRRPQPEMKGFNFCCECAEIYKRPPTLVLPLRDAQGPCKYHLPFVSMYLYINSSAPQPFSILLTWGRLSCENLLCDTIQDDLSPTKNLLKISYHGELFISNCPHWVVTQVLATSCTAFLHYGRRGEQKARHTFISEKVVSGMCLATLCLHAWIHRVIAWDVLRDSKERLYGTLHYPWCKSDTALVGHSIRYTRLCLVYLTMWPTCAVSTT